MFKSLSILHGCAVCTEYVKFLFCLPLPFCPHKLLTCFKHEIRCVYKLTEGLYYGNASYIRQNSLCCGLLPNFTVIAIVYIRVSVHAAVRTQRSSSSLGMPAYTENDKEMAFPALQYVHSHCEHCYGCLYIHCSHMQKCWSFMCLDFFNQFLSVEEQGHQNSSGLLILYCLHWPIW